MRATSPSLLLASILVASTVASLPAEAHTRDGHHAHDDHGHGHGRADRFEADLDPVNTDGEGRVRLRERKGGLVVKLRAKDLDDGIHVAHIHGVARAQSECPDGWFDEDQNGLVDLVEGLPAYGPVQLTLSDGLNDTGTRLRYKRTYTELDNGQPLSSLGDLSQYAVVVHGVDLDDDHVANNPDTGDDGATDHDDNEITMPALCGVIEKD